MPLVSITGSDAYANLRNNPDSLWPDGRRDATRLSGVAQVRFEPSFRLIPGEAIFTVGSCFARNIEQRLAEIGYDIPTTRVTLPADERASDTENDILNKYAPHSILNEFRWALEPGARFPQGGYVTAGGKARDMHMAPNVSPAPLDRVVERRQAVEALYREIPRCRVIVMTLGLVEAWYDNETQLYLNAAPSLSILRTNPERFRLDILSVDDIVGVLEEIHGLLTAYGHPEFKMLLTVSPVPFRSTFSGQDAISANSYSKSALRVAAQMFSMRHGDVDYFPSYEIVTHTLRTSAFIQDNRHVTSDVVRAIIDRVEIAYSPGDQLEEVETRNARKRRIDIREATKAGDFLSAVKLFASLENKARYERAGYDEFRFRYEYGKALMRIDSKADAQAQLSRAVELKPGSAAASFNLGLVLARLQRPLEAETMLRRAVVLDPDTPGRRLRLIMQMLENGRLVEAGAELADILKTQPDFEAVARALAVLLKGGALSGKSRPSTAEAVTTAANLLRDSLLSLKEPVA